MKLSFEIDSDRLISTIQVVGQRLERDLQQPLPRSGVNAAALNKLASLADTESLQVSEFTESVAADEKAKRQPRHFLIEDENDGEADDQFELKGEEQDQKKEAGEACAQQPQDHGNGNFGKKSAASQSKKRSSTIPYEKSVARQKFAEIGRVQTKELFETQFQFLKFEKGSMAGQLNEPLAQNYTAE